MPHFSHPTSSKSARQDRILQLLQGEGVCTYTVLEARLGVSSMTIRRDVDELARRGLAIKSLGGAQGTKTPSFLHETAISSRFEVRRAEKELIAEAALKLVEPGQCIFLDGGTTTIALARKLAKTRLELSVITNSALVALELGRGPTLKVILLGGEYDSQSACCVGALAEETANKFSVDAMFISTKAFLPSDGTYESGLGTLRLKQVAASRAARKILLVDSSKFGLRALCRVFAVRDFDVIVTDAGCKPAALRSLRSAHIHVIVAPPV